MFAKELYSLPHAESEGNQTHCVSFCFSYHFTVLIVYQDLTRSSQDLTASHALELKKLHHHKHCPERLSQLSMKKNMSRHMFANNVHKSL